MNLFQCVIEGKNEPGHQAYVFAGIAIYRKALSLKKVNLHSSYKNIVSDGMGG